MGMTTARANLALAHRCQPNRLRAIHKPVGAGLVPALLGAHQPTWYTNEGRHKTCPYNHPKNGESAMTSKEEKKRRKALARAQQAQERAGAEAEVDKVLPFSRSSL